MKQLLLTTIAAVLLVGCGHLAPIVARLNSSIHKAARAGHIEVVKKHLAAGVKVRVPSRAPFLDFQKTRVKVLRLVFLSFSGPFLGAQTNSANGPV